MMPRANAHPPKDTQMSDAGVKTHSQAGHLLFATDARELQNQTNPQAVLLDWRSHTIKRVVRSTFAAEAMSACEAYSAAIYLRACLLEVVHGFNPCEIEVDPALMRIIGVTDCKSLFDTVHRDGTVKLPSESRLALEVAALKEMIFHEAGESYDPKALYSLPFRWVPTDLQLRRRLSDQGHVLRLIVCHDERRTIEAVRRCLR